MDEKFRQLIELGAGEFEHANSSLIAHLEGTRCLLKAWNATDVMQDAGLYHVAYSTAAFDKNVFELSQRKAIAGVIGSHTENIVYHYYACDMNKFFAQFIQSEQADTSLFYDRITAKSSVISHELLQQICELTAANKTEMAIRDPDYVALHGSGIVDLFSRMQGFLSFSAQRKIQHVFASHF